MNRYRIGALCVAGMLAFAPLAGAFNIDFEGLPAGYVIFELSEGAGASGGLPGVIGVLGFSPAFGLQINPVIVFDSSNPTGGDVDLGTPNQAHGGPGRKHDRHLHVSDTAVYAPRSAYAVFRAGRTGNY